MLGAASCNINDSSDTDVISEFKDTNEQFFDTETDIIATDESIVDTSGVIESSETTESQIAETIESTESETAKVTETESETTETIESETTEVETTVVPETTESETTESETTEVIETTETETETEVITTETIEPETTEVETTVVPETTEVEITESETTEVIETIETESEATEPETTEYETTEVIESTETETEDITTETTDSETTVPETTESETTEVIETTETESETEVIITETTESETTESETAEPETTESVTTVPETTKSEITEVTETIESETDTETEIEITESIESETIEIESETELITEEETTSETEYVEGQKFSSNERIQMMRKLDAFPTTVEFDIKIDHATEENNVRSVLFGNDDHWNYGIMYMITKEGNPQDFDNDLSLSKNNLTKVKLWLDKSEVEDVGEYDYSFAVIGDTQWLSREYPDTLSDIYDWIVANKDEHKIAYAIGVGDITQDDKPEEWEYVADQIFKLDGVVPYSLVMGNHDKYQYRDNNLVVEDNRDLLFNQTFYVDNYLDELDGWYAEGDVSCSYNAFELGNTKWLLVNLDFGPTEDMLKWACGVVEAHPDHRVIIATHAYLYRDGTTIDKEDCYPASAYYENFKNGDDIWNDFASKYENIELILCGHDPWDHIVCARDKGDNGNVVTQLLVDQQYIDSYYGATGMIAMLYYSESNNTMTVRWYSTVKDCYGSEYSQFTFQLN